MSSEVEPPENIAARSHSEPDADEADSDGRRLDLIALICIVGLCAGICLAAGTATLEAVIGAAGVLFAAWRAPGPVRRGKRTSRPARRSRRDD